MTMHDDRPRDGASPTVLESSSLLTDAELAAANRLRRQIGGPDRFPARITPAALLSVLAQRPFEPVARDAFEILLYHPATDDASLAAAVTTMRGEGYPVDEIARAAPAGPLTWAALATCIDHSHPQASRLRASLLRFCGAALAVPQVRAFHMAAPRLGAEAMTRCLQHASDETEAATIWNAACDAGLAPVLLVMAAAFEDFPPHRLHLLPPIIGPMVEELLSDPRLGRSDVQYALASLAIMADDAETASMLVTRLASFPLGEEGLLRALEWLRPMVRATVSLSPGLLTTVLTNGTDAQRLRALRLLGSPPFAHPTTRGASPGCRLRARGGSR